MNEETLFHLAREKTPEERATFLDKACGGDEALRRRMKAPFVSFWTCSVFKDFSSH
jgi:hypothetical protein